MILLRLPKLTFVKMATIHKYTMMKYCRYICAGTNTGLVNFLDPETLQVIKSWQAHTDTIYTMDAQNSYLVTCGWSTRPYGQRSLDAFAKVFDLRKLEQLPPISCPGGAAFVQMHPKMSTTGIIASQFGQMQVIDLMNPGASHLHMANVSAMLSLVVAPSGDAWAFHDQENQIHLWGPFSPLKKMQFVEHPNPTEFADEAAPLRPMAVDGNEYAFSLAAS